MKKMNVDGVGQNAAGSMPSATRLGTWTRKRMLLAATAVLVAAAGCDDEGSSTAPEGSGYLQVALTGSGSAEGMAADLVGSTEEENGRDVSETIEKAEVWISEVYFQGVPGQGRVEVFSADDHADNNDNGDNGNGDQDDGGRLLIDLMELQEGVDVVLGEDAQEVEPGEYGQLRFVVDEAEVTLNEGYEFADGERTQALSIPSGAQSGIKVHPPRDDDENGDDNNGENGEGDEVGVDVAEGSTVTVVVEVDVEGNFVFQGPPHDTTIQGVLFTPTLQQSRVDVNGSGG